MRFLAGETCDLTVVRALRAEGHDVLAVSEFQQRSVDSEVLSLALSQDRILLTEDKDFGWLTHAARADSPGVILIRYPASSRGSLADAVRSLVRDHGESLERAFVVVSPGLVRISHRPERGCIAARGELRFLPQQAAKMREQVR